MTNMNDADRDKILNDKKILINMALTNLRGQSQLDFIFNQLEEAIALTEKAMKKEFADKLDLIPNYQLTNELIEYKKELEGKEKTNG